MESVKKPCLLAFRKTVKWFSCDLGIFFICPSQYGEPSGTSTCSLLSDMVTTQGFPPMDMLIITVKWSSTLSFISRTSKWSQFVLLRLTLQQAKSPSGLSSRKSKWIVQPNFYWPTLKCQSHPLEKLNVNHFLCVPLRHPSPIPIWGLTFSFWITSSRWVWLLFFFEKLGYQWLYLC